MRFVSSCRQCGKYFGIGINRLFASPACQSGKKKLLSELVRSYRDEIERVILDAKIFSNQHLFATVKSRITPLVRRLTVTLNFQMSLSVRF